MDKSIEPTVYLCKQNVPEPNNNKNKIREVENITKLYPFSICLHSLHVFTLYRIRREMRDKKIVKGES
jgi:hypothetical protein